MAFAMGDLLRPVKHWLPSVAGRMRRHVGAIHHEHVREGWRGNPDPVARPDVQLARVVLCHDGDTAVVGVRRCVEQIVRRVRRLNPQQKLRLSSVAVSAE